MVKSEWRNDGGKEAETESRKRSNKDSFYVYSKNFVEGMHLMWCRHTSMTMIEDRIFTAILWFSDDPTFGNNWSYEHKWNVDVY